MLNDFGLVSSTSQAGVKVDDPVQQVFNGQEVEVWPRITWKPKWGLIFSDIKSKVGGSCSISQKSTLAIKGRNIFLENLSLDGALIVDSVDDAEVCLNKALTNSTLILFSAFSSFHFPWAAY